MLRKCSPRLGQTSLITTPVFSLGSCMNADTNCIMVQLICRASNYQMHLLQLYVSPVYVNLHYTARVQTWVISLHASPKNVKAVRKSSNKKMR